MIKFAMCITRHPDMSREEFKDYWMNKHGPFFMENAGAMRAKKYVQSHTLDTPLNEGLRSSRGMRPEYDGVAEVWFESEEELIEGMSSPEGQKLGAALLEDEGNFIDHSKSSAFIVKEYELKQLTTRMQPDSVEPRRWCGAVCGEYLEASNYLYLAQSRHLALKYRGLLRARNESLARYQEVRNSNQSTFIAMFGKAREQSTEQELRFRQHEFGVPY